jgi:N-acetylglucosaminyldiphosphoundecaprenol N-acetyl-beta-D-mannosaminyltransferase
MEGALETIDRLIEGRGTHLVATINPEFVMRARADPEYAAVLDSSALSLIDGWGVRWAARRAGCTDAQRVPGVDLVLSIAARCAETGRRMFLLGAGPGVAQAAAARLVAAYPGLVIAGCHSGSPRPEDDQAAVDLIAAAKPQMLLVAYGAPSQEAWIARNRSRLPDLVAIGVGGTLDYIAGRVARAPAWMRRLGLEWLYRLLRQPWRARRMAVLPVYAIQVLRSGK